MIRMHFEIECPECERTYKLFPETYFAKAEITNLFNEPKTHCECGNDFPDATKFGRELEDPSGRDYPPSYY